MPKKNPGPAVPSSTGMIVITFRGGDPATKKRRSAADLQSNKLFEFLSQASALMPMLNRLVEIGWRNDSAGFHVIIQARP